MLRFAKRYLFAPWQIDIGKTIIVGSVDHLEGLSGGEVLAHLPLHILEVGSVQSHSIGRVDAGGTLPMLMIVFDFGLNQLTILHRQDHVLAIVDQIGVQWRGH